MTDPRSNCWWDAEEGEVHKLLLPCVEAIENAQEDVANRFLRLAFLYDPYDRLTQGAGFTTPAIDARVSENVVASNIDTVAAVVSRNKPRAKFETEDAEWSVQRQMRRLGTYADGLVKLLDIQPTRQRSAKDSAKFGTGCVEVWHDKTKIYVERVLADEIIVDESECRANRKPRQMHRRRFMHWVEAAAMFPEHEEDIKAARATQDPNSRWWANYRELEDWQVVVIESWWLPIGEKPGRHTWCIRGADLKDEPYMKGRFPISEIRWNERTTGWYGIGLAERIAGHQRQLNKYNWQLDRLIQQLAVPTTYVHINDADLAVKSTDRIPGTVVPYRIDPPKTIIPTAFSPEMYSRTKDIKASAFEESGVSRLAASAVMPGGLESAVAQREYKATTNERFSIQEQALDDHFCDILYLVLDCCKEMGANAPKVAQQSRWGRKYIDWPSLKMDDVKVRITVASDLPYTPAGREQFVIEMAQAGVVDQDEARRLMRHPDIERAMSIYTSALEDIERCIEEMLDGRDVVPEPYQNLKMGTWRVQMALLKAQGDGAPDEILENLRQWLQQASDILAMQNQPVPGTVIQSGAEEMPMAPGQPEVPMPSGLPGGPQPVSALAPSAMTLRPSAVPASGSR